MPEVLAFDNEHGFEDPTRHLVAREYYVLVMSPQKLRVEWLVSSPTESNVYQFHPLGFMLASSFQSLCPSLEFSSHFLSSLSWQDLQKELGGAPRSCL